MNTPEEHSNGIRKNDDVRPSVDKTVQSRKVQRAYRPDLAPLEKPELPMPSTSEDHPAFKVLARFAELTQSDPHNDADRLQAKLLVNQYGEAKVLSVMEQALTASWWADKITSFGFFYDKFEDKLLPGFVAFERGKKVQTNIKAAKPSAHTNRSGMGF
jgi:hypothetical protein